MAKINRLLQIEAELEASSSLATWEEHVFPLIRPPTPPEEGEEGEGEAEKGEGENTEDGAPSDDTTSKKAEGEGKSDTKSEAKGDQ